MERNVKDMMEDLDDAGVPLEEYSDDEDAAGMWMGWQCFDYTEVVIEIQVTFLSICHFLPPIFDLVGGSLIYPQ